MFVNWTRVHVQHVRIYLRIEEKDNSAASFFLPLEAQYSGTNHLSVTCVGLALCETSISILPVAESAFEKSSIAFCAGQTVLFFIPPSWRHVTAQHPFSHRSAARKLRGPIWTEQLLLSVFRKVFVWEIEDPWQVKLCWKQNVTHQLKRTSGDQAFIKIT